MQPPELHIPTIDLSPAAGISDEDLAATLLQALNNVGFLHVLNPGPSLTIGDVRKVFSAGTELFGLPLEEKEKVGFNVENGAGYTPMLGQTTGARAGRFRGDVKESFSIGVSMEESIPISSESTSTTLRSFREACFDTGRRLLDLFTIALKIQNDPLYFRSRHTYGNNESLRLIHYPAFPKATPTDIQAKDTKWADLKLGEQDLRAGPHQDFGSATLLFQSPPDDLGASTAVDGLEIFVRREDGIALAPDGSGDKGWWVPAPKPQGVSEGGSILVNVGVSMEIWSGEQFKATWHRVVCPAPPIDATEIPGRHSVVFFMIPDNDVTLDPIDGNGRPAVAEGHMNMGEFFKMRMNRSYGKA